MKSTNVIFFGPPGVGKGTQAKNLALKLKLPHIDTGSLIREAIQNETELGKRAKQIVEGGNLLPDNLVNELIRERLLDLRQDKSCPHKGFILDGFPRTIGQAEALTKISDELKLPDIIVLNIQAPEDLLIKRLSSRRICSNKKCGEIYNIFTKKPREDGRCSLCGSELFQRKDDLKEACKQRLVEYHNKTAPVEKYYKDRKVIIDIDGSKESDEVFNEIIKILS